MILKNIGAVEVDSIKAPDAQATVPTLSALLTFDRDDRVNYVYMAGRTTSGDGGGGVFRWDSTNLSSQVTADPLSGIYVAPSSASTGASGAWVRIDWDGTVKAFGAKGDGVTDDTAAFKYAIAASTNIYVPPGEYYITETLNIKSCLNLHGANGNQVSGFSSVIKFKADIVGIFIHRHNTNASITGVPVIVSSGGAGDGTILSRLKIRSVGGVADAASHGVWSKARFRITNCYITGFQGDGVHVYASTSGSDPYTLGNANNWHIDNLATYSNGGHGLYVVGSDVNAGVATLIDSSFNVDGIKDSSFLGNTYLACHTSANTGIPYNITGASAKCVLVGCYQEGGQSASVINTRSICIGGTNSFSQSINADSGVITFSSGVLVQGGDGTVTCKVNEGTGVALGMYNTLNPNGFKYRYSASGEDLYFGYANSSPGIAMTVTGPNTTEVYGRSVAQPYKITGNFMVGTTSPRARDTRTAAPTTGEWARGDIVYNASPSAGGFVGWVCVAAGTPGTWKTFGDISA